MSAPLWLHELRHRVFGQQTRSNRYKARPRSVLPCLEVLEDRLVPSADSVQVVAASSSAPFSEAAQRVTLSANVTDTTTPSTTVGEGQVKFTVVNSSGNTIGTAASGTVTSSGKASVSYSIPAFTLVGSYTIDVSYSDSKGTFTDGGKDTTGSLTVTPAPTITTASAATATFSGSPQNVTLSANVTSNGLPVNEGTVRFAVVNNNGNTIGTSATGAVTSNGNASVSYGMPAFTLAGSYTIEASYDDGAGNFAASADDSQALTVSSANATKVDLAKVSVVPNVSKSSAQVTLTAQVSNPAGTVGEGAVLFQMDGVSAQGNVVNGTAQVQLTVPIQTVINSVNVSLTYHDNAAAANFANDHVFEKVSGNVWSGLLPTSLTFAADGSEQIRVQLGGQTQLGFSYAPSGLLTQINVGPMSFPVAYSNVSGNKVVTIDGVPWQINFFNSMGQYQGIQTLILNGDGTTSWLILNSNGQVVGEMPSS